MKEKIASFLSDYMGKTITANDFDAYAADGYAVLLKDGSQFLLPFDFKDPWTDVEEVEFKSWPPTAGYPVTHI